MPFEQAHKIIVEGSGLHFDPDVVATYIREVETFQRIAQAYAE